MVQKAIEYFYRQMERGLIENDHQQEVFETAISALEKQIPKEPEREYIPQYKYASPTAICPICKGIVESPLMNDDYCRDCGQAIKWQDTP